MALAGSLIRNNVVGDRVLLVNRELWAVMDTESKAMLRSLWRVRLPPPP